jgi:transcriptional regulator with XRE-family HTH domain
MDPLEIGLDVARLRKQARLTQVELARRADTTQAVISRLETGSKLPGYAVLDRIVAATGRELKVTFGRRTTSPTRQERRRRVRQVLGDDAFDPWDRDPTPVEARALIADGLDDQRSTRP